MGTKRGLKLGAATIAVAAIGAVAPALAGTTYGSKVTLANSFPAFHGKVKSDGGGICIEDRRVRLYSQSAGQDELLGKARTKSSGKWKIVMEPSSGVYYAKVKKGGSASLGIKCKGDESKPVVID